MAGAATTQGVLSVYLFGEKKITYLVDLFINGTKHLSKENPMPK